jgi:hypothetical protein
LGTILPVSLCSAIIPSSSLWTITLAARIIVRDHNLVAECQRQRENVEKSAG